jgi:hypothetical protein
LSSGPATAHPAHRHNNQNMAMRFMGRGALTWAAL